MIHEKDKYLKINSKVSIEGGGGHNHCVSYNKTFRGLAGSHNHSSPSYLEIVHKAVCVILSNTNGEIEIHKNRYDGMTGKVTGEEFLDTVLKMLAIKLYNGTSDIFQEAFIQDAKKQLKKVLKKHSKVERMVH